MQRDEAMEQLAVIKTELKEAVEKAEIAVKERNRSEEEAEKLVSVDHTSKVTSWLIMMGAA